MTSENLKIKDKDNVVIVTAKKIKIHDKDFISNLFSSSKNVKTSTCPIELSV